MAVEKNATALSSGFTVYFREEKNADGFFYGM
jgi:hypothetical protein